MTKHLILPLSLCIVVCKFLSAQLFLSITSLSSSYCDNCIVKINKRQPVDLLSYFLSYKREKEFKM